MDIYNRIDNSLSDREIKALNLPTTRKKQYFDIIKTQFGNLTKTNLLTMLFCLPLLILIVLFIPSTSSVFGSAYSFIGNLGIGYPGTSDSIVTAEIEVIMSKIWMYFLLVPTLAVAGIGFAGMMRVVRNMVWGENVIVKIDFWKGIKEDWKQFTLVSTIIGIFASVMAYNMLMYRVCQLTNTNTWLTVTGYVLSIIAICLMIGFVVYLFPMMSMYQNKLLIHIKNSIILSIAKLPMTVFMIAVVGLSILILGLGALGVYFGICMFIFLFVFFPLMWTTYVQFVMDKHINGVEHNRAYKRGIYEATKKENNETNVDKPKKNTSTHYVNPKKLKKNATITPLSEHYSRADLAKLEEEKNNLDEELQDNGDM